MNQLDLFSTAQKIPNSAPGLYYNTTGLTGHVLKERQFRAGSQNDLILKFFQIHPGELFTPLAIWRRFTTRKVISNHTPATSIRRSMTTLTKMGYLIKTDRKVPEEYGEDNYTWRLK